MKPLRSLRHHLASLVLLLASLAPAAHAEVLHAPQICPPRLLELKVVNFSNAESSFWLLKRASERAEEERLDIGGGESLTLKGIEFLRDGGTFSVRAFNPSLRFYLSCSGQLPMTPVTSPRVEYAVRGGLAYDFRWQNLHRGTQSLRVQYFSRDGRTLHELNLEGGAYEEHRRVDLVAPDEAVSLLIEADGRLSTALLDPRTGRVQTPAVNVPVKVDADPGLTYFLASDRDGHESFSFGISNPALIQKARSALARGRALIVIAQIEAADKPGINRDFAARDRSPWSWRVSEVFDFAELAHISCDGAPSLIEDYLPQWLGPGGGRICLWGYHLKRELTLDEVRTGQP